MAIVNPRVISQSVSDPDFLSRALTEIFGRGIMGLGSGVLLDDHLMNHYESIKDGEFVPKNMADQDMFWPQELIVVMNEHHSSNPLPLDSLKQMLQGGTGMRFNREKYVNGRYIKGEYDIELVLAYNPSAPSLYIFTFDKKDNWDDLKNYNTPSDDIVKQIETKLDNLKPITWEGHALDKDLSAFVDTSIRLIYLMKRISPYAAINYQEV
jgi:hypothetical protein